jgi:threonine aldolase
MQRRQFLSAAPAAFQVRTPSLPTADSQRIYAYGDGIPLTAEEYSQLLAKLSSAGSAAEDDYSREGCVAKLEQRIAALLGKEAAVWFPSGTLANHVAVRMLAGERRRVLVQAESHLYRDCGDCCQTLSGLTLAGLAPGRPSFTIGDVEAASTDSQTGRVMTPIGAIQIETPVRRAMGRRFDFEELTKVAAWARERKIGLHLDGARLFIESSYTGRPVREYAALFDTVYVSMYKYFNAASGAVLAGPASLLANLYHTRRMFGGGLHQVWPFAAIALYYVEGFEARFKRAVETGKRVTAELAKDGNFEVDTAPDGTNVFRLKVFNVNAPVYQNRLEAAGISARAPIGGWLILQVNETWNRVSAPDIVARFRQALG